MPLDNSVLRVLKQLARDTTIRPEYREAAKDVLKTEAARGRAGRPGVSDAIRAAIVDDLRAGIKQTDIAAKHNEHVDVVRRIAKAEGITRYKKRK